MPLERNLRIGRSELDLVVLDSQTQELVVVEVKTRGSGSAIAGHPSLSVKGRKWLALLRAGSILVHRFPKAQGLRFDIVTVSRTGVEHLPNITWSL